MESPNVCQSYLWAIFGPDGERCTEIATTTRSGKDVCDQCATVIDLMVED